MEKELNVLLDENGKTINGDKAEVTFEVNSIDIMEIDDEGYNLYGEKFYSAYEAYNRLEQIGALKEESRNGKL